MSDELYRKSAHELGRMRSQGAVSVSEIVRSFDQRLEAVEEDVQSFVSVIDGGPPETKPHLLSGLPAAIKDNICIENVATTCSSKMLQNYVPPYDATVIQRLENAGYYFRGKTNMDEFAMGSSTEHSAFGPTHNPWSLDCVPGGSSGGSAAAVAAGEVAYALGSDTGGSIRQPASFCGVVGLKPTYGRVSRYGLVAFASSLDQIGPITKDVTDAALVLQVIAGHDPRDSTSVDRAVVDYTASLKADLSGMRIGLPEEYFEEGLNPGVKAAVSHAAEQLEQAGARCEPCSLPNTSYALDAYYLVATAEASSNLARYDGMRYGHRAVGAGDYREMFQRTRAEGFGPEVKRRILLGTFALSSGYYDDYYLKAQKVRTLIRREMEDAFEQYDVLLTPTAPTPAFEIGAKKDPLSMYLSDILTIPANMAGVPAISVPAGTVDGLPVGLQLIGPTFGEEQILHAAYAWEQLNEPWHGNGSGRRYEGGAVAQPPEHVAVSI